jgi:hypothetical protein
MNRAAGETLSPVCLTDCPARYPRKKIFRAIDYKIPSLALSE